MLYLEDYLEMIEHLPQELRDRFTEMREMDLSVQNSMDSLEKRVKTFFTNAKKMKTMDKDNEYEVIRKDYYKTLEDADEKVSLANQMYDLVDRYLRRLDQELHKFKMELEADNKGITEVLEKRSLELDQPQPNSSQKENRYNFNSTRTTHHGVSGYTEKRRDSNSSAVSVEKRLAVEKASTSVPEPRPVSTVPPAAPTTPPSTSVSYSLGHIGAGGNAIAAAASQAIAATQQMQQGRRTASLKASYEAINIGVHAHEFSIGKELAGAAIAAIQETTKKQKKKAVVPTASSSTSLAVSPSTSVAAPTPPAIPSPPPPPEVEDPTASLDATVDPNADNPDWTYDPNEPRYCICNQVSYGYMVACDNDDCPFEWFHYACVDIKAPPKGKWYCPQCTSSMKRRGSRKN